MKKSIILLGIFIPVIFIILGLNKNQSNKTNKKTSYPQKKKSYKKFENTSQNEFVIFNVDSVEQNTKAIADTSFEFAFAQLTGSQAFVCPEEHRLKRVQVIHNNGFGAAIDKAFTYHYPLAICPDDVWLLICQGFAQHVNANPKKYEKLLLKANHPKVLAIRNDNLPNLASNDWKNLIASFTNEADKYLISETKNFFDKKFTTTTPIHTTVYNATLMETLKSYFTYYSASGCGIPYVKLKGTTDDWTKIYNALDELNQYEMGFWVKELKPIIKEFIAASGGKPNLKFWKSIYKDSKMYGATYISGWMLKLYPYLETVSSMNSTDSGSYVQTNYKLNPFIKGNDYLFSDLGIDDLPDGYTKTKVIWQNFFAKGGVETKNLELNAGFLGIQQDEKTGEISTVISWAFIDEAAPKVVQEYYQGDDMPMHKNGINFIPQVTKKPDQWPVYNTPQNKDYESGKTAFLGEIANNLKNEKAIKKDQAIKLNFVVTWMGTIERIHVASGNAGLDKKIESIIKKMGALWLPGKFDEGEIDMPEMNTATYANVEINWEFKLN